jgi:hypothetical protein
VAAFGSGDPCTNVKEHREESKEGTSKIDKRETDGLYKGIRVVRVICRSTEHQCREREREREKRGSRGTKQVQYIPGVLVI